MPLRQSSSCRRLSSTYLSRLHPSTRIQILRRLSSPQPTSGLSSLPLSTVVRRYCAAKRGMACLGLCRVSTLSDRFRSGLTRTPRSQVKLDLVSMFSSCVSPSAVKKQVAHESPRKMPCELFSAGEDSRSIHVPMPAISPCGGRGPCLLVTCFHRLLDVSDTEGS